MKATERSEGDEKSHIHFEVAGSNVNSKTAATNVFTICRNFAGCLKIFE
jgi:hypothetical protein